MQFFKQFPAPFLRCSFVFSSKADRWILQNLGPVAASEIPDEHREFVVSAAAEYFRGRRRSGGGRTRSRYDLAILVDPQDPEPPSDRRAIQRFLRAAEQIGFNPELIEKDDFGRITEFDALFIRETTSVNHHTYRVARKASAEGLVVIDDPESILKCTNKVFLAELLERNKVPIPRTMIVHRGNREQVAVTLGLPCILKQPDSSFSRGVLKIETEGELKEGIASLLEKSELVIAQEFLPTSFDWRVGIFDRQPLFACRYYMAKSHWQILKHDGAGRLTDEGRFDTLPVEHLPTPVLRTALKAANLIGDGLYGVDLKQVGDQVYIIEINDNPNLDAGVEDRVLKGEIYRRVMHVLLHRVKQRKERGAA